MRMLILGIGSPFGNDSLGWQVVDALVERGVQQMLAPHEVRLEKADRPGLLLLERMRGTDCVILIDALLGGGMSGRVHRLGVSDLARGDLRLSGHDLGVAEALALGEALGELPGQLWVLGIEVDAGGDCAPAHSIAETEPATVDEIVAQIRELIPPISVPRPVPG